ncbi:MAG: hypothetical protein HDQ98_12930 [Lachnospiraceae bacterium]|nr:hypothetical protein [Lachnospiraceae bacterium]
MKHRIGMTISVLAFVICILIAAVLDDGKMVREDIWGSENPDAGAAGLPVQTESRVFGAKADDGESGADGDVDDAKETFPDDARVYEDAMAVADEYSLFAEEWWVPYADEETVAVIRDAYAKIDFNGEFETGEPEVYEEYRQRFWALMQGDGWIIEQETGEEYSISEFMKKSFSGDSEEYDPEDHEYTYFLYDINGDGCPELGIREGRFLTYFLCYDKETDRFRVWYQMNGYRPLGVRKGMYALINELTYSFSEGAYILLDENADMACRTYFFSQWTSEGTLYMVMLPIYADKGQEAEVTWEMKEQGVYIRSAGCMQSLGDSVSQRELYTEGQWFFRVTREQYDELTASYLEAYRNWNQERCKVQYSYEELFGDFIRAASKKEETVGNHGRMTQREAVEVLLYYLYQDVEMIREYDPPIYEFQFVRGNPLDSYSLMCLVYERSSPDGLYYFFALLDQLYDDPEDRYERKFYRSAYLNDFAVNRETGEVFREREWDDTDMWEYSEEYQRIANMGQEDE